MCTNVSVPIDFLSDSDIEEMIANIIPVMTWSGWSTQCNMFDLVTQNVSFLAHHSYSFFIGYISDIKLICISILMKVAGIAFISDLVSVKI